MKKILFVISIFIVGLSNVMAQQFSFEKKFVNKDSQDVFIDYGTIKKGADGHRTFTFTNTGDKALIISRVQTSCGCTTPEYSKEPILPGKEGTIVVKYDTNRVGPFKKSITVYSNALNNERKVLKIRGNILN